SHFPEMQTTVAGDRVRGSNGCTSADSLRQSCRGTNSIRKEVTPSPELVQALIMKKSEKFNSSGYLDLTAYQALKNIERENAEMQIPERKRKKRKKKRRKAAKK
ncbi:MAG: hypothetical protein IKI93_10055, partial [Clostridia bacterium]|nr:hypothetical protein [Clostridia bacterium]